MIVGPAASVDVRVESKREELSVSNSGLLYHCELFDDHSDEFVFTVIVERNRERCALGEYVRMPGDHIKAGDNPGALAPPL